MQKIVLNCMLLLLIYITKSEVNVFSTKSTFSYIHKLKYKENLFLNIYNFCKFPHDKNKLWLAFPLILDSFVVAIVASIHFLQESSPNFWDLREQYHEPFLSKHDQLDNKLFWYAVPGLLCLEVASEGHCPSCI